MVRVLTYLPAVGLLGLATYQAVNQHDVFAAAHSAGQAATLLGLGTIGAVLTNLHSVLAVRSDPESSR